VRSFPVNEVIGEADRRPLALKRCCHLCHGR